MQDVSSPCPIAGAARDTRAVNTLRPHHAELCHILCCLRRSPGGATAAVPAQTGALPTAQTGSAPACRCGDMQVCQHPFSHRSQHNEFPRNSTGSKGQTGNPHQDKVGVWPPMPGWEMFSHWGFCLLLLLLLASPPSQPPTAARAAHSSHLLVVGGFPLHAQNKSKEREGPTASDKTTPDQIPFLVFSKITAGLCSPAHHTRFQKFHSGDPQGTQPWGNPGYIQQVSLNLCHFSASRGEGKFRLGEE